MGQISLDEDNPGETLRNLLCDIYPFEFKRSDDAKRVGGNGIDDLDRLLKADGELARTVYLSTIDYVVRRLITAARMMYRKQIDPFNSTTYVRELRDYLVYYTTIPGNQREKIMTLLRKCVDESESSGPTQSTKDRVRKNARGRDLKCHICGGSPSQADYEVEHIWPRSLGGASTDRNLEMACPECNRAKQDYMDGSDFHYEEICLVSDEDSPSFPTDFKGIYRVAVSAKQLYRCASCKKLFSEVGEMSFVRRNQHDTWHYLNIQAICPACQQKLRK